VQRLLVAAGAGMLVWSVLVVADADISQRIARQALSTASRPALPASPRGPVEAPPIVSLDAARAPLPVRGAAVAELSIPRVRLSAVVLHGSDARTLRRGPGHLENTALPGESGNAVIAGHRDSFFRPLQDVELGDDIFVDTPRGRFRYRVSSLDVVDPHDLSVLEPTGGSILTLITCYPFRVLGPAPDRYVVRAARVDVPRPSPPSTAVAVTLPITPAPPEPVRALLAPAPIRRPPFKETAATALAPAGERTIYDDEALVRQTIERFRLTYNARLVSHQDARPGGLLSFQTCDVVIGGDHAAATCRAPARMPDESAPQKWTLTFERTGDGWAIRLIETT
jgi:sortase A